MARATGQSPLVIFGASGQVGGAIFREATRRGLRVVGTYRGHPQPGLVPWEADRSAADLLERDTPWAVIYAVGFTNVDACETHEEEANRWNARVPVEMARAGRGRFQVVYFSTDYVFDGAGGPYAEADAVRPLSAYGRSKVRGEEGVLSVNPSALVVRTTVVYGPEAQGKNFVAQIRARLSAGDRMRVANDQLSTPTYNEDLAAGTLDLLERQASGIWHVSGPEVMSRAAFAQLAAETFHLDAQGLEPMPTALLRQSARRPLHAGLKIDKLLHAALPHPVRSAREGLQAYAAGEGHARPQ